MNTCPMISQVELVLNIEELLPTRLRRHFIEEEQTVEPNGKISMIDRFRYKVFGAENSHFHSQEDISNALHPQPVSACLHRRTIGLK